MASRSAASTPQDAGRPEPGAVLHLGPVPIDPVTWIYTTVTLMALLVVFEGWGEIDGVGGIVAVVVGPTIALAAAHVFAHTLGHSIAHAHGPDRSAIRELTLGFVQYLVVAAAALLVLFVASVLLRQPPLESVRSMLLGGLLSLGVWGGVAGWQAGQRGGKLVLCVVAGLIIGLIVFAFQVVLKPH